MHLKAHTRGLKYVYQQIDYQVCTTDSLAKTRSYGNITQIFYKNMADLWHRDERVIQSTGRDGHKAMLSTRNCSVCSDISYMLLNYDNTTYRGDRMKLDRAGNIKVKTDEPFRDMPLFLKSYYRALPGGVNCTFIKPQQTLLNFEVCGTETIKVKNARLPLELNYTKYQDPDIFLNMTKLRGLFKLNSTTCNFTRWELRNNTRQSLEDTGPTIWSTFIKINDRTNMLDIKHNTAPPMFNNTKFTIYLVGTTMGKVEAYKKLIFTFYNN